MKLYIAAALLAGFGAAAIAQQNTPSPAQPVVQAQPAAQPAAAPAPVEPAAQPVAAPAPAQPAAQPAAVPAPAQPAAQPAAAPAQPVAAPVAAPVSALPGMKVTRDDLKKKHIDAVAELKKKQVDEMRALKDSLKGKPEADIKKAVAARKKEQKVTLKALEKANEMEMGQYRKDHPRKQK